jgi:hypothetical protein
MAAARFRRRRSRKTKTFSTNADIYSVAPFEVTPPSAASYRSRAVCCVLSPSSSSSSSSALHQRSTPRVSLVCRRVVAAVVTHRDLQEKNARSLPVGNGGNQFGSRRRRRARCRGSRGGCVRAVAATRSEKRRRLLRRRRRRKNRRRRHPYRRLSDRLSTRTRDS